MHCTNNTELLKINPKIRPFAHVIRFSAKFFVGMFFKDKRIDQKSNKRFDSQMDAHSSNRSGLPNCCIYWLIGF